MDDEEDDNTDELIMDLAKMAHLTRARKMGGGFAAKQSAYVNTETVSFLARFTTQPSATYRNAYDRFITRMKSGTGSGVNIWALRDGIYFYAAPDTQAALLNLKSTSYNGTYTTTPLTFVAGRGFSGSAVSGTVTSIDTGFNPSTAGGNYTQNSASCAIFIGSEQQVTANSFGNTNCGITVRSTTNTYTGRNQSGTASSVSSITSCKSKLFQNVRDASGSGGDKRRINGVAQTVTGGTSSGALFNSNFLVHGSDTLGTSIEVAYVSWGASNSVPASLDEYNAVAEFLTAIGYVF